MTDISTVWDVAEASGDWDFVPTVVKTTQLQINAQPFVVGGPSGTAFSLLGGAPGLSQPVAGSIYRNDWQGNQLLYPTPRTNTCPQSQSLQSWTTNSSPTVSANAAVAPDGTTTATLISGTGSANCGIFKQSSGITTSVGTVVTFSTYVQFYSGTPSQRLFLQGTAFPLSPFATFNTQTGAVTGTSGLISSSSVAIGGGWFRVSMTASATAAGIATPVLYSGTTSAFGNYLWGAQVELSTSVPTAYIPTTTSAVTVTDYTVDQFGNGTMAVTEPTASYSWTGSCLSTTITPGGYLASGDDLSTSVLISLFTDRLATPTDSLPDLTNDRRGWWGDLDQDVPIGSRLWLLSRAKLIAATATQAKGYILEALQWLIDDGVAASVTADTTIVNPNQLNAMVGIQQSDGTQRNMAFNWVWDQIN